jgi:nickel-dependent lactate racemase
MMHVSVQFQGERLEFEVDDARVVACWEGPTGMATTVASAAARGILEQPWDFPPFRQMIVPGDRVTIALDATIVRPQTILEVLVQMLREAGVEAEEVTILATSGSHRFENVAGPDIKVVVHDATDRTELAYLAATNQGRRIYLNRHLTDADAVIPVGRLGYDPIMGYRGPWSVVFPELSEMAAIDTHRGRFHDEADDLTGARSKANLDESFEAGWLLGSQFQVGIVPGTSGWAEIAQRGLDLER